MKTVLLATAATLALTAAAFAAGNPMLAAGGARGAAHRAIHAPPKGLTALYDQNIGDAGYGWFSQTLSSYPQYDEYLADDFVVPAGHTWKVKEVDTTGFYYQGTGGPAHSVNVLFWGDKKGLPDKGSKVAECDDLKPKSGLDTGAFQITLPKSCKVSLDGSGKRGTRYWLTVQANMDGVNTSGYWAWMQNVNVANKQGAGYYYGGGNSVSDPQCLQQFEGIQDCWNAAGPVDLAFALLGKDKGG
ncbi:MAG: hypothetical protein JO208_09955 [Alphaproteobacteria bacterium]|nr:hypothetical protein [Alphaproteobacteria bacterium]